MPKDIPNPLLTVAQDVTEEHLAEVEAKIVEKEKELAGLKEARRVGMRVLGKAPERTPGVRKPREQRQPFDLDGTRRRVARFLSDGTKTGHDLITKAGVAPTKLAEAMDCSWFTKTTQGYHLTTLGRQQAL